MLKRSKWFILPNPLQVPLCLVFKNESVGTEMIEILQFLFRKYAPVSYLQADMEKSIHLIQPIFLGNDNPRSMLEIFKVLWQMGKRF